MMIHIQEITWKNQAEIFEIWSDDPYLTWLDSASTADPRGRYGYLCVEPFQVLAARGACVAVNGRSVEGDPFQALQRELARWRLEPGLAPVPFAGGAVGFLGYELGGRLERLPQRHLDGLGIPDMVVAFHDIVLAFDAEARRCWILLSGFPETAPAARQCRAVTRANAVLRRLEGAPPLRRPVPAVCTPT